MANHVLNVANLFLRLGERDGVSISNMKLQKLLYFAQGHCLGSFNRPLVDEAPEAWQYGPVFPSVYHAFKQYGSQTITQLAAQYSPFDQELHPYPAEVAAEDMPLVEAVWNAYKDRSPIQLSEMSHAPGGPWDTVFRTSEFRNADLSADDMAQFFRPRSK